jgi:transposase-like protein
MMKGLSRTTSIAKIWFCCAGPRCTFGRHTPIQRCQVHKARNIVERLPKHLHASVRSALRQSWELDDAEKAERLIRNLARRPAARVPATSRWPARPAWC